MNIQQKILTIRVALQNADIKKSGFNKHANFHYYELSDFLPTLNNLFKENNLNDCFTIEDGYAILLLMSRDDGDEKGEFQKYSIPFEMFEVPKNLKKDKNGNFMKEGDTFIKVPQMQQIQYLGALNTYYKRYLYMNAFGITDGEVIDGSMMRPVWWDQAVHFLRAGEGKIDTIEKKYSLSKEQREALMDEAANG